MKERHIETRIRIPRDMWIALRRLEEQRYIHSIQQAVEIGLRHVIENRERIRDDKPPFTNTTTNDS